MSKRFLFSEKNYLLLILSLSVILLGTYAIGPVLAQDDQLFGEQKQHSNAGSNLPVFNDENRIGFEDAPEGMPIPDDVLKTMPLEVQPDYLLMLIANRRANFGFRRW